MQSVSDDVIAFIERRQQHGVEVNRPDPIVGRLEAHGIGSYEHKIKRYLD